MYQEEQRQSRVNCTSGGQLQRMKHQHDLIFQESWRAQVTLKMCIAWYPAVWCAVMYAMLARVCLELLSVCVCDHLRKADPANLFDRVQVSRAS